MNVSENPANVPFKEIGVIVLTITYFIFLRFFYPPVFYIMCILVSAIAIIAASPKMLIPLNLLILFVAAVGLLTGELGLKNFRSI
jgi:hypothetical protein